MPRKKSLIDPKVLKDVLDYNPATGALTWKARPVSMFNDGAYSAERLAKKWNSKYAGKPAFTSLDDGGYCVGSVLNEVHKAHRVIWALVHGYWPEEDVDHLKGVQNDNRLAKLREVTVEINNRNTARSRRNTSGHTGIDWHKHDQKWRVRVCKKHVGKFDNIEDAIVSRQKAVEAKGGFTNRHGELKP